MLQPITIARNGRPGQSMLSRALGAFRRRRFAYNWHTMARRNDSAALPEPRMPTLGPTRSN